MKNANRIVVNAILLGAASLLCFGCSTVKSIDVAKASVAERNDAYINYAVAKSFFTIQISAASDSTKPGGASGSGTSSNSGSQGAKPGGSTGSGTSSGSGSQSTNQTWTISGTVTQSSGAGTPPSQDSSKKSAAQTPDATECGVLTAQYTEMQTIVANEITTYNGLVARLLQMEIGKPAAKDTPKKLAADLTAYVNVVNDASNYKLITSDKPDAGSAMELYNKLVAQCAPKVSVTVAQSFVPDTNHIFALKARNNPLYTDTLNFSTDANGFLTNAAPTSTSQVPAILGSIANTLGQFVAPAAAAVSSGHPGEKLTIEVQIAALAKSTSPKTEKIAEAILTIGLLPTPGSISNLPSSALPMTIYATFDAMPNEAGVVPAGTTSKPAFDNAKDNLGLTFKFDCSSRNGASGVESGTSHDIGAIPNSVYDGLVVSAPRACQLTATQTRPTPKDPTAQTVVAQSYFWAQDSNDLVVLPERRGILVARGTTYTFANGQATGVNDSRPSEVAAFVALPGNIVGTFISGVTTGVSNNLVFINGETSDITAQTNKDVAETNLANAQTAEQKAQAAAPSQ